MGRDWDKFDNEGYENRIQAILGEGDAQQVSENSIIKYRKYLKAHLTLPCVLTPG